MYVDNCILMSPSKKDMDGVIKSLHASEQNFTIDDEGEVGNFLGVKIQKNKDGTITLTQPQLMDLFLEDLHMQENVKVKSNTWLLNQAAAQGCRGQGPSP